MERVAPSVRDARCAVMAGLVMAVGLAEASAQEARTVDLTSPLARELLSCMEVEDDGQRLACFDRVTEPLVQRAQQDETVLQGEGDWDSENLTLERPWRLAWHLEGSILTIELRDGIGRLESIVGNQIGAGEGASEVLRPGTWRLAVRAVGTWEVRVVEDASD
ncbi:MAG: hypothetical protein ACFCUQ_05235 [Kiloniellales bacterium]